jgi:hypothetical protein
MKWLLAIEAAVCCGGGGIVSPTSERGDLPTIVEALVNCAEEDRPEGEALDGVTPPTPCREFMDAFLSSVGVDARELWLIELGDRWRGLRGGILPFGDAVELFRWGKPLLGETLCGEVGSDVAEAALIESCFSEFERASLLFVDAGKGAVS